MMFDAMVKTSQNLVLFHVDYCHPSRSDNPYNWYINPLTMKHMVKDWSKQFTDLPEAPICKPKPKKSLHHCHLWCPFPTGRKKHLSPSSMPPLSLLPTHFDMLYFMDHQNQTCCYLRRIPLYINHHCKRDIATWGHDLYLDNWVKVSTCRCRFRLRLNPNDPPPKLT